MPRYSAFVKTTHFNSTYLPTTKHRIAEIPEYKTNTIITTNTISTSLYNFWRHVPKGNQWLQVGFSNIAISISGFVTGIIIARGLDPADRGILAQAQVWIPICTSILGIFNLQSVNFLIGTTAKESDRQALMNRLIVSNIILTLACCAICLLITLLSFHSSPDLVLYSAINIGQIPPLLFGGIYAGHLFATQQIHQYWRNRVLVGLAFFSTIGILYLTNSVDVLRVSLATVFTTYLGAAGLALNYHRSRSFQVATNTDLLKGKYLWCWKSTISGLPSQFNLKAGILALTYMGSERDVGVFAISQAFSGILLLIGSSISTIFITRSTKSLMDRTERNLIRTAEKATFVLAATGCLFALICPLAIPLLFGKAYSDSVTSAVILCIAFVGQSANLISNEICRGLGRPDVGLKTELGIIIITIICIATQASSVTPEGISIALGLAYWIGYGYYHKQLYKITKVTT